MILVVLTAVLIGAGAAAIWFLSKRSPGILLIGRYRLSSNPFPWTYGAWFQGKELESGRGVEIYVVREELKFSEKNLERVRYAASLKHENLLEMHDVFSEEGRLYLVTDRFEGKSLRRLLKERRTLPIREAKKILLQSADALAYAHGNKVIHGDITPRNILVGGDGRIKLREFRVGSEVRRVAARSGWKGALLTLPYMAPEVELGELGAEADVYSLGVLLYEMLSGRLPFEGPDFLNQKRAMRYPALSDFVRGAFTEIDGFLQLALQPEPGRRFHAAGDFKDALARLPEG